MLTRNFEFLKHKYRELLIPIILLALSSKLCVFIDGILIGYFVNTLELSAINIANPFIYINGVLYYLFGVSGSLLALRAKAMQDSKSSDFYFTIALVGIIIVSIIYSIVTFLFAEQIITLVLNVPQNVVDSALTYIHISALSFPFLCYMYCLSFFTTSDGFPKLTSRAMIASNIANLILSAILMGVFNLDIAGSAIGTVLGNIIGAIWISTYFIKENRQFNIIKYSKMKITKVMNLIYDFATNAPDVVGKISYTIKISFYTALCSTYLGPVGLTTYFLYDNSETLVYMFLSGITKVTSPIIAIFYKEKDYEAVRHIFRNSLKQIILFSIPFALFFAIFPEVFAGLFSITEPEYLKVITLALRITAVGLIGRSVSQLLANYSQAIEKNRAASFLNLSRELLIAVIAGVIFTRLFGGIGIWYAIVLSDILPILIYFIISVRFQRKNAETIENHLMLQKTNTISLTIERENENLDYYINEASEEEIDEVRGILGDKTKIATNSTSKVIHLILDNANDINRIDITIRYFEDILTLTFTYEGELYNHVKEEKDEELEKIGGEIEYLPVLGFNRVYINIPI